MKFGDIVRNEWAGEKNPQKILMVVRVGKVINCLSIKGEKVDFYNDKHLRLTVIGQIDFSAWREADEKITRRSR